MFGIENYWSELFRFEQRLRKFYVSSNERLHVKRPIEDVKFHSLQYQLEGMFILYRNFVVNS